MGFSMGVSIRNISVENSSGVFPMDVCMSGSPYTYVGLEIPTKDVGQEFSTSIIGREIPDAR